MQGKNDEVTYIFEPACQLGAKLAGVHWWFKSRAHAAELTAGYYNTRERNGYIPLMGVLKRYHTHLSFTCVEMRDCEHPPEGRCSPQGWPFISSTHLPLCTGLARVSYAYLKWLLVPVFPFFLCLAVVTPSATCTLQRY